MNGLVNSKLRRARTDKKFAKRLKMLIILYVFVTIAFSACNYGNKSSTNARVIDFSEKAEEGVYTPNPDSAGRLNVALAAMISPRETFTYYEELLKYVSQKIDYKVEFKQRKTYQEINTLIEKQEVDLAFICSGAYLEGKAINSMELLTVPVCNGHPSYRAYIIVNKLSAIQNFSDLQDKSFAFTDPMSNTGKLYADKRVHELGFAENTFFKKTVFSYAHDVSMQLVAKQIVDGATVDGLIFEYLKKFHPDRVKNLRIIETSEEFGIPPVVVPTGLNPALKQKLKNIFYTMHEDSTGKKILDKLLIEKFVAGNDAEYNSLRKIKQALKK